MVIKYFTFNWTSFPDFFCQFFIVCATDKRPVSLKKFYIQAVKQMILVFLLQTTTKNLPIVTVNEKISKSKYHSIVHYSCVLLFIHYSSLGNHLHHNSELKLN